MKPDSSLSRLETFIEMLLLKLLPLAILLLAYLRLVHWTEQTYSLEKLDFPWLAAMMLTLIPLTLIAALFYSGLKSLWAASKAQVMALGIVLFLVGSVGSRAVMQLNHFFKAGYESVAISSLKKLYVAQHKFKAINKKYATLRELAEAQLIPQSFLHEEGTRGYKYSVSDISALTFCLHADRIKNGMGDRDFLLTESGELCYIVTRIKGTVLKGTGEKLYSIEEQRPFL